VNSSEAFGRGSKRCMKVVLEDLAASGVDVEEVKEKIVVLVQKYLTGMFPFLKYYYNATFPKQKGQCFHVVGVDVLLDDQMNPWLL
jgi:tubulin polyglutamylase TTLL6/13